MRVDKQGGFEPSVEKFLYRQFEVKCAFHIVASAAYKAITRFFNICEMRVGVGDLCWTISESG
jgi:hypothetical protein